MIRHKENLANNKLFQKVKDLEEDISEVLKKSSNLKRAENLLANLKELGIKVGGEKKGFFIVNMGLVKAGKSEFFNALVEKEEFFKTGVVRTTSELQEEEWNLKGEKIILVDTPGLDAAGASQDEEEAIKGYRRADLILFIHNLRNGEFDSIEVKFLKKLKAVIAEKDSPDIVFLFTKKDQMIEEDCKKVTEKCKKQIEEYLGINKPKIFEVSSVLYLKGLKENNPLKKQAFIKASGIEDFKKWLEDYTKETIKEAINSSITRFNKICEELKMILTKEKEKIERKLKEIEKTEKEKMQKIDNLFKELKRKIENSSLKQTKEEIYNLFKFMGIYNK